MERLYCKSVVIVLSVIGFCGIVGANPTTYQGSLTWDNTANSPLVAEGGWASTDTTLSWKIDDTTTPGKWHYEYTLTVPQGGISHMIIEASDDDPGPEFTAANLFSPSSDPVGWIDDPIEIGLQKTGSGNPSMPADMYGIRFNAKDDDDVDYTTVKIIFDSDRGPTWGDFYAKDGSKGGPLYNQGFLTSDPLDPPSDGSVLNHLLVPDTTVIPAPGAVVLGGIGVVCVGWLRRRRTL